MCLLLRDIKKRASQQPDGLGISLVVVIALDSLQGFTILKTKIMKIRKLEVFDICDEYLKTYTFTVDFVKYFKITKRRNFFTLIGRDGEVSMTIKANNYRINGKYKTGDQLPPE